MKRSSLFLGARSLWTKPLLEATKIGFFAPPKGILLGCAVIIRGTTTPGLPGR
ncbi:MAG: hypothetical protein RMM53_01115 [Bacteroidia bacterium]|nr:hypothetical protein [Bacteroidia bacterium]MDW8332793.1 hypothetical protein [Bacteroidia bacterium]